MVDRAKKLKEPLQKEAKRLRRESLSPASIMLELAHPSVANPELQIQQFCAQQKVRFAAARLKSAEASKKIVAYNVGEIRAKRMSGDLAAQLRRLEAWNREIAAAQADQDAALAEGKRIHAEMIAE